MRGGASTSYYMLLSVNFPKMTAVTCDICWRVADWVHMFIWCVVKGRVAVMMSVLIQRPCGWDVAVCGGWEGSPLARLALFYMS